MRVQGALGGFLRLGMVIGMVLLFSAVFFPMAASGPGAEPDRLTLTWADDPRTTQTITWRTETTLVPGEVEYKEEGALRGNRVTATVKEMVVEGRTVSLHSITLTGLKPGTRYTYQVGNSSHWSSPQTFQTAPAQNRPFTFLIFGDSQSTNYKVWGRTLHQAYQRHPEAAFMVNVGDLVDVGQSDKEWQGWFTGARGVIENIPVIPVVGNHETYTPNKGFSMPVFFTAQFKVPQNGPVGLKGQVYSFDYGDVHFSILDSQAGEERQFVPDMLEWQRVWLNRDLAASNKKWKLVFIHRPLYHNRAGEREAQLQGAFLDILDKHHVDAVFSGHDHVYARTVPLFEGMPVSTARPGTVYVTTGRSGTKTYPKAAAKQLDAFFYNPLESPVYLTVEVLEGCLKVKAFTEQGSLLDEWELRK